MLEINVYNANLCIDQVAVLYEPQCFKECCCKGSIQCYVDCSYKMFNLAKKKKL